MEKKKLLALINNFVISYRKGNIILEDNDYEISTRELNKNSNDTFISFKSKNSLSYLDIIIWNFDNSFSYFIVNDNNEILSGKLDLSNIIDIDEILFDVLSDNNRINFDINLPKIILNQI